MDRRLELDIKGNCGIVIVHCDKDKKYVEKNVLIESDKKIFTSRKQKKEDVFLYKSAHT